MSELPDEQAITSTAGLRSAALIRHTSGYPSYCCRSRRTSSFPRGMTARRRGRPLTRFERLHVQRIPERSFETRSSIASKTWRATRDALASRSMPGMVLKAALPHSPDALRPRTWAVEEQPSSCGIPKTDVTMREQRLRAHKALSAGLADRRKSC